MDQSKANLFAYCKSKLLGFSLIEVLIALAMTAIGLLGFMQLQMRALYTAQEAANALCANILARDMIGRAQANYGYAYNQTSPINIASYPLPSSLGLCYNSEADANFSACRSDQMASLDLYEWSKQVADRLPNGRAIICNDPGYNPGGNNADPAATTCVASPVSGQFTETYTLKIFWQARDLTWKNYLAYVRPYNRD